ncbi:MAG: hypothetical protein JNL32_08295 [Candidatus Kapabacteria bacterium]|nr:hypothetical protein [Candidatus Kapabacteria bacterium]
MTAKQLAYETISALVQHFEKQYESYMNYINCLVYQLYDVTEEEIKIVEGDQ